MKPVPFPNQNVKFVSSDKKIKDEIPAWRGKDASGNECVVTFWELTPEDIVRMGENKQLGVYLTTKGSTAPICALQAHDPFAKPKPVKAPSKIISMN